MNETENWRDAEKAQTRKSNIIAAVILGVIVLAIAAAVIVPKIDVPMKKAPNLPRGGILIERSVPGDVLLWTEGESGVADSSLTGIKGLHTTDPRAQETFWSADTTGRWLAIDMNLYKVTPDKLVRLSKKDWIIQLISDDGLVTYVMSGDNVKRFDAGNGTRTTIRLNKHVRRNEGGWLKTHMTTQDGSRYLWCWGHGPFNDEINDFEYTYDTYVWYDGRTEQIDLDGRVPIGLTADGTGIWAVGADKKGLFALKDGELITIDAEADVSDYIITPDCRQLIYTGKGGTFLSVDFGAPRRLTDAEGFGEGTEVSIFRSKIASCDDFRGELLQLGDEASVVDGQLVRTYKELLFLDNAFVPHVLKNVPEQAEWTAAKTACCFLCTAPSKTDGKVNDLWLVSSAGAWVALPGDPVMGTPVLSHDGKTAYWIDRDGTAKKWSGGTSEVLVDGAEKLLLCADGTPVVLTKQAGQRLLYTVRDGMNVMNAMDVADVYVNGSNIAYLTDTAVLWYGTTDGVYYKIAENVKSINWLD